MAKEKPNQAVAVEHEEAESEEVEHELYFWKKIS
jgi:hypothetical protein